MDQKIFNGMVRPCIAKGHRAAFHRWVEHSYVEPPVTIGVMAGSSNGGQVTYLTALVEFETGQVVEVRPNDIVFRDFSVNRMWNEGGVLANDAWYEDWLKAYDEANTKKEAEKSQ